MSEVVRFQPCRLRRMLLPSRPTGSYRLALPDTEIRHNSDADRGIDAAGCRRSVATCPTMLAVIPGSSLSVTVSCQGRHIMVDVGLADLVDRLLKGISRFDRVDNRPFVLVVPPEGPRYS